MGRLSLLFSSSFPVFVGFFDFNSRKNPSAFRFFFPLIVLVYSAFFFFFQTSSTAYILHPQLLRFPPVPQCFYDFLFFSVSVFFSPPESCGFPTTSFFPPPPFGQFFLLSGLDPAPPRRIFSTPFSLRFSGHFSPLRFLCPPWRPFLNTVPPKTRLAALIFSLLGIFSCQRMSLSHDSVFSLGVFPPPEVFSFPTTTPPKLSQLGVLDPLFPFTFPGAASPGDDTFFFFFLQGSA